MNSYLPQNDKNIVGKVKVDRNLIKSEDWYAAKERADINAAGRVVDHIWSDKKTELLRASVKDPENVIFITQPSSSRTNVVPVALAEKLSHEFSAKYIDGDDYFETLHRRQSKHIPQGRRIFERREYELFDPVGFHYKLGDNKVVVVEDILTTGGSVADFTYKLKENGVRVESIVSLMGDKRLRVDEKTYDKFEYALNNKNIKINSRDLIDQLTRAEAGGLIRTINSVRSDNAKEKLTRNIQGLLDKRAIKDLGRDQITKGYREQQGSNKGNESITERVQAWQVRDKPKLTPYVSQKDIFIDSLNNHQAKEKKKTQNIEKTTIQIPGKGFKF